MSEKLFSEFPAEVMAEHFPVDREAKIPTMQEPVIIESACPGWQPGGKRFPAVPISIENQVMELVDSVKAGAVAIHVHPRNPATGNAAVDPRLLKRVLDPVFDQVDCVTLNHTWCPKDEADYISETEELLELGGGNKYCQGAVVLPIGYTGAKRVYHSERTVVEGVKWLEANHVKPIYQLYDTFAIFGVKQKVLDRGISGWRPHVFNLHLGKHHSHTVHRDPWAFTQLITNYNMVKETAPPGSIIGVYPGGRNWLPVLVLGLMLGAQLVRVGIEDCYWVYPHRDEVIRKNSDMVKLAVDIIGNLGRRVVTDAEEARQILGLRLTSK